MISLINRLTPVNFVPQFSSTQSVVSPRFGSTCLKPTLTKDTVSFSGLGIHDLPPQELHGSRNNLSSPFKKLISTVAYMQTQTFRQERQTVFDNAKAYLEDMLINQPDGNIAIAMDLDETLLDNTGSELQKMVRSGSTGKIHTEWRKAADCPAIPETLNFFNWVRSVEWTDNQGHEHKGIPVFFVTARRDKIFDPDLKQEVDLSQETTDNLEKIGLTPQDYAGLYLRPNIKGNWEKSGDYKSRIYSEINANGHNLVMVVGDMDSDFQDFEGYRAQLPNPLHID